MAFTNIPWTQVVLAICAVIGVLITLITRFHKLATAALDKAVLDLKEDLKDIHKTVTEINTKVGIQNGRVGKLEDWRMEHTRHSERMFDYIKAHMDKERET